MRGKTGTYVRTLELECFYEEIKVPIRVLAVHLYLIELTEIELILLN